MNTSVTLFDPTQVPAHVRKAQQSGASNIVTRSQVNALTFPGKVWTVVIDGSKRPLMRTNNDGEEELVQTFECVVIAYNENRGRSYYANQTYDANAEKAPVCWSNDGVTSDPRSTERQSEKCSTCPQAIKGSRHTDQGVAAAACRVHRHLAVIPNSKNLAGSPVLRLKIPQTSDWDGLNKEAQARQMFAFSNYLNYLKSKQVPMTYSVITKIRFDNNKSYPKLWFSPSRYLTDEEEAICKEIAASPGLDEILRTDFSGFGNVNARPPGVTEEDEEEVDEGVEAAAPAPAPKPAPTPKPAPAPAAAAPAPSVNGKDKAKPSTAQKKAEAAAAAAAARKSAALVEDDDEDENMTPAPKAAAPVHSSPALDKILTDWDDE